MGEGNKDIPGRGRVWAKVWHWQEAEHETSTVTEACEAVRDWLWRALNDRLRSLDLNLQAKGTLGGYRYGHLGIWNITPRASVQVEQVGSRCIRAETHLTPSHVPLCSAEAPQSLQSYKNYSFFPSLLPIFYCSHRTHPAQIHPIWKLSLPSSRWFPLWGPSVSCSGILQWYVVFLCIPARWRNLQGQVVNLIQFCISSA